MCVAVATFHGISIVLVCKLQSRACVRTAGGCGNCKEGLHGHGIAAPWVGLCCALVANL